MANPWIQQIAERLDDLQPVNGSYVQAIAQLLNQLPNTPGQVGIDVPFTTTSTNVSTIYEIQFDSEKQVGFFEYNIIGRRGNLATYYVKNEIAYNLNATTRCIVPNVANNTSLTVVRDYGDDLGLVEINSDAVNNKIIITVSPNSATSTEWKLNIRFVTIP
jgi:hypothetical protein